MIKFTALTFANLVLLSPDETRMRVGSHARNLGQLFLNAFPNTIMYSI